MLVTCSMEAHGLHFLRLAGIASGRGITGSNFMTVRDRIVVLAAGKMMSNNQSCRAWT